MVGHDGDSVIEPHDLTHTLDCFGCRIIHALYTAAKDGDCASVAIFTLAATSMP